MGWGDQEHQLIIKGKFEKLWLELLIMCVLLS